MVRAVVKFVLGAKTSNSATSSLRGFTFLRTSMKKGTSCESANKKKTPYEVILCGYTECPKKNRENRANSLNCR